MSLVTNLNDSGPGSLRAALDAANANIALDLIHFKSGLNGTITLESALAEITTQVDIDGLASGESEPRIQIDFNGHSGLVFAKGSGGSHLTGLGLVNASGAAVKLLSGENTVQNNFIGLALDGSTLAANGGDGIQIQSTSTGNLIGSLTPESSTSWNTISQVDGFSIGSVQGIREALAEGDFILCGTGNEGSSSQNIGLLYKGDANGADGQWYVVNAAAAFNGSNTGANASITSCYGPEQISDAIVRVVGSYNASASAADISGFVYTGPIDAADNTTEGFIQYKHPGSQWTFLHSTEEGLVVGNWDNTPPPDLDKPLVGVGKAFIYDIETESAIADIRYPGSKSTTAYGIAKVNDNLFAITGSYSLSGEADHTGHGYLVYYHRESGEFTDWTSWDVDDSSLGSVVSHADGISYNSADNTFTLATVALQANATNSPIGGYLMTVQRTSEGDFGSMRWTNVDYDNGLSGSGITIPTSVAADVMTGEFVASAGGSRSWSSATTFTMDPSNVISGNGGNGIALVGSTLTTGTNNIIAQNRVGTSADGATALANDENGILVEGSLHNKISDNLISGNDGYGVSFLGMTPAQADQQLEGQLQVVDSNANGDFQVAPGWANLSLSKATDGNYFTIAANTTISLRRQDTGSPHVTFGVERLAGGTPLMLSRFNAAHQDSLSLSKITTNHWRSTEGVAQGGLQQTAIESGSWIPVATDSSGRKLALESLTLTGNSAKASFAGGVEAVFAVGGSGVLADAITLGNQANVTATVRRLAGYDNGLAVYEADALTGAVSGLLPGTQGYLAAALKVAQEAGSVYSAFELPKFGQSGSLNLSLDPSKNYGFLLLVDGSENKLYSSYSAANPGGSVQVTSYTTSDGSLALGFEDLWTNGASDHDFNDIILTLPIDTAKDVPSPVNYRIGTLFPRLPDGSPNILLSSSLQLRTINGESRVVPASTTQASLASVSPDSLSSNGTLEKSMILSSDPVRIPGINRFLVDWFIPQLTAIKNPQSLFNKYRNKVLGQWESTPRNNSLEDLLKIGYFGPDQDKASSSDAYWSSNGSKDDEVFASVSDLSFYDPEKLWSSYAGGIEVKSNFDVEALLENLAKLEDSDSQLQPDLWYPSMLYTFGVEGKGTSYPAPVLMAQPGDSLRLHFTNDIKIDGLNTHQNQQASLIENSTYGNTAADGLGAVNSVNFHLHGSHTNPGGFGDNVVARYTTGQTWTTEIDLPSDHGQGSYAYHPHYHPSVNQMVYGGMSGPAQFGDPLSKVPLFKDVPRNLAVLKTMQVGIDSGTGQLLLDGFDNLGGVINRMTMVTVNGEFQPTADTSGGGWQALTLSNQTNQAFYNISLVHTDLQGDKSSLPLYIYGEDGHQYPQIRSASEGALGTGSAGDVYKQAQDLVSLPPFKRLDLLVYLPDGKTEISSSYSFEQGGDPYAVSVSGGYPELSSDNTGFGANTGAGPLAVFEVKGGTSMPSRSDLDAVISRANQGIDVQTILPTTQQSEYDPLQIPSVDLFAQDAQGSDLWTPIRRRQFNWTKNTLVGPASEYDAATQALLAEYSAQNGGATYEPYTKLPVGEAGVEKWMGYNQPFLINDHVFPNGSLTITQLGTMEEWVNRNWSIGSAEKYIGHPFHIHINDYQVKDSDSELSDKRNLEDVTQLNSSGYRYYNTKLGKVVESAPLKGDPYYIDAAVDKDKVGDLYTFGANDQTIRMLFQDYLGTYVFHCHILPHEDAGMMQVMTVVENTGSSWLVEAQSFAEQSGRVQLYQAQSFDGVTLSAVAPSGQSWQRAQSGDIGKDFVQDLALSSGGGANAGAIEIFDGAALQRGETLRSSSLTPYANSTLAPWVFIEDFSGDGQRDLVTAGFNQAQTATVNLQDLEIKAFLASPSTDGWVEQFKFDPFDSISLESPTSVVPRAALTADQVSVAMADMNLDNFQDVAIAYAVEGGLRLIVLDGAALSLQYQTGQFEGGYFPDSNVLADAVFLDTSLGDLSQLVLTSGFSSYAQSALENLILTTTSSSGSQQFTFQLQAGHFIATNIPDAHSGVSQPDDSRVTNLRNDSMPLFVAEEFLLADGTDAVTATISGGLGHGGTLVNGYAVVAQGNSANGNQVDSDTLVNGQQQLINTTQQLVIPLDGLNRITVDDLTGIVDTSSASTFTATEVRERYQLTAMTYLAYTGQLLWPSALAEQAASILGTNQQASALVSGLLASPEYRAEIESLYGGPLANQTVDRIVEVAYSTLYGRTATSSELQDWKDAVSAGLDQTLLPQSILQSTVATDADSYRVAALSGISQWTALQWGTTAEVIGSFGQGLVGDLTVSDQLDGLAANLATFSSWEEAQQGFDVYSSEAMKALIGTPVSKSGFF